MYDKFGRVLRLETTTNDVAFFKHHRTVERRDGTSECKLTAMKRSIYSLGDLRRLLLASDLSQQRPSASTNQVSRYIKRLRVYGIINRIGRRYKYYITDLGHRVVLTGLKLRELFVIPHLNALPSPT